MIDTAAGGSSERVAAIVRAHLLLVCSSPVRVHELVHANPPQLPLHPYGYAADHFRHQSLHYIHGIQSDRCYRIGYHQCSLTHHRKDPMFLMLPPPSLSTPTRSMPQGRSINFPVPLLLAFLTVKKCVSRLVTETRQIYSFHLTSICSWSFLPCIAGTHEWITNDEALHPLSRFARNQLRPLSHRHFTASPDRAA